MGASCVALLVRGGSDETILLTGHFDTVGVEDYGDLKARATKPDALADALLSNLAYPGTDAEKRAKADLESGDYLPGRGLLDMKAGLAAALAAAEDFASSTVKPNGSLLFVAVPDEEAYSAGARTLAMAMPEIERAHRIRVTAAINLDAIADDGDGGEGRVFTTGSVGKLLLTALVTGQSSHASYPFSGLNAGAIAAALAARLEWAPELADRTASQIGMPPTLLGIRDGKTAYDVTTPASAFAIWNCLTLGRSATKVLDGFRRIAEQVAGDFVAMLETRRRDVLGSDHAASRWIEVLDFDTLCRSLDQIEGATGQLVGFAREVACTEADFPHQCQLLTEKAFALSGRTQPTIVLGFGSVPYPAISLTDGDAALRLRAAIDQSQRVQAKNGVSIKIMPFFQGISDMSFIGETETFDKDFVASNTPVWHAIGWGGEIGNIPIINIGPWGRDYHTRLERLYTPYAFDILPGLLLDVTRDYLASKGAP